MRAIIPVAGIGSRLRPHTYTIPKVLLNVAGKPIIGHIMDKIIAGGFDAATIVVGYLEYVEQEERLGLGHAIYLSRHTISKDPILIILGDTVFDVNLPSMMKGEYSSIGVKDARTRASLDHGKAAADMCRAFGAGDVMDVESAWRRRHHGKEELCESTR